MILKTGWFYIASRVVSREIRRGTKREKVGSPADVLKKGKDLLSLTVKEVRIHLAGLCTSRWG